MQPLRLKLALVQPGRVPRASGIGPPWGKDQKLAASLAMAALGARS